MNIRPYTMELTNDDLEVLLVSQYEDNDEILVLKIGDSEWWIEKSEIESFCRLLNNMTDKK